MKNRIEYIPKQSKGKRQKSITPILPVLSEWYIPNCLQEIDGRNKSCVQISSVSVQLLYYQVNITNILEVLIALFF